MNDQSKMMNQAQMINPVNHHQPQPQPPMMTMTMMNQSLPLVPNRGFNNKVWLQSSSMDSNQQFRNSLKPNYYIPKPSKLGRSNWKGRKVPDRYKDPRRMDKPVPSTSMTGPTPANCAGYRPPTLNELQPQNCSKARKFYSKKKFNNNRFARYAPRNTTSFIIRAKKAGGVASLVSPCPITPAVLPTPTFSPSREVLVDMAKEEWGVDSYGSMKGLIRLRADGHGEEEEEEVGGGSSESDVEEHVEVERRLDHDLSRFEMIYPNYGVEYNNVLENRVDDQDSHIAQLEEENFILRERLYLMDRELGDLRRRLQFLEGMTEDVSEEVVENVSENESEGGSDAPDMGVENNVDMVEYVSENRRYGDIDIDEKGDNDGMFKSEVVGNVCAEQIVSDQPVDEGAKRLSLDNAVSNGNDIKDGLENIESVACEHMNSKDGLCSQ